MLETFLKRVFLRDQYIKIHAQNYTVSQKTRYGINDYGLESEI